MSQADTSSEELLQADQGGVRILTLNRPEQANALSPALSRRLAEAVIEAEDDAAIKVIVLAGSGQRHFCAGADLKARADRESDGVKGRPAMRGTRRSLFEAILECSKPTIAAIDGAAYGAGFELALCCDMRVAADGATMCLPEARRGMGAHYGTVLLPLLAPRGIAYELLFTGAPIDARRAYDIGLVNRLTDAGGALAEALALAEVIAGNAPLSLARMKATVRRAQGLPAAVALRLDEGISTHGSHDSREGVRAFLEKRPPRWEGR